MDPTLKKLSIVIPIYNVEEYLSECLNSLGPILGHNAIEIILVNDGSTDNSFSIAKAYSDRYENIILVNKSNGGLSDARNVGVKYVDTEYIFFLDSDDKIDGSMLLRALSFAELNNLDWIQCGYAYDYGEKILVYKTKNRPTFMTRKSVMLELIKDGYIKNFAWGKIYRTNIVKKIEFPLGRYFEDSFWQYKVVQASNRFGLFLDLVTFYRLRAESISGTFSLRNLDLLEGLRSRLDFIINNYTDMAPITAMELWRTAKQFDSLACASSSETKKTYSLALKDIIYNYSELILRGFKEQPFLLRIAYRQIFKETLFSPFYALAIRIYNRFQASEFEIHIHKKF